MGEASGLVQTWLELGLSLTYDNFLVLILVLDVFYVLKLMFSASSDPYVQSTQRSKTYICCPSDTVLDKLLDFLRLVSPKDHLFYTHYPRSLYLLQDINLRKKKFLNALLCTIDCF